MLIAFLLYLTLFFAPFQQLSMAFDSYQRAKVGVRRVGELLDTPTSVPQAPEAVPVPRRLRGEIDLRGVATAIRARPPRPCPGWISGCGRGSGSRWSARPDRGSPQW